jgi:amphiphysin
MKGESENVVNKVYNVTIPTDEKSPADQPAATALSNGMPPATDTETNTQSSPAAGRESSVGKAPPLVSDTGEYEPVGQQNGVESPSRGAKRAEEVYDIPVGATTEDLPEGCLYKVRATYRYNKEDGDELSFDAGEIIQVQEYEDPEDQEEGWLTGQKESTGEKGLFPANFTRPI